MYLIKVHIQDILVTPFVTVLHGVPRLQHLQDLEEVFLAGGQHHHPWVEHVAVSHSCAIVTTVENIVCMLVSYYVCVDKHNLQMAETWKANIFLSISSWGKIYFPCMFLHVLSRFLQITDILQEMYSLRETCKKCIEMQESSKSCIILRDSWKKYVFGGIFQDTSKKCIFTQLKIFYEGMVISICMVVFFHTSFVNSPSRRKVNVEI